MINGSFPIVAQKTMDICQLRLDWSLLILITYTILQLHHSNNCSQLLLRSEFQKKFWCRLLFRPEFRRENYQRPLLFFFFWSEKQTSVSFRNFGYGRAAWFIQHHSFCAISFVESAQTLNTLGNMLLKFLVDTENY